MTQSLHQEETLGKPKEPGTTRGGTCAEAPPCMPDQLQARERGAEKNMCPNKKKKKANHFVKLERRGVRTGGEEIGGPDKRKNETWLVGENGGKCKCPLKRKKRKRGDTQRREKNQAKGGRGGAIQFLQTNECHQIGAGIQKDLGVSAKKAGPRKSGGWTGRSDRQLYTKRRIRKFKPN